MERIKPQPGQLYQHFKGMLYQIITVAKHSETGEELVIYQALYGDFMTYARPLSMFLSEVDHEKYPNVTKEYRFTLMLREELSSDNGQRCSDDLIKDANSGIADHSNKDELDLGVADHSKKDELNLGVADYSKKDVLNLGVEEHSKKDEFHPEVNYDLMAFLDAKDCEEKLEILYSIRKNIDERMMGNIEIALDLPVGEGTIEERIDLVKNNLQMMAKYENRRLR